MFISFHTTSLLKVLGHASVRSVAALLAGSLGWLVLEPVAIHAISATDSFVVTQEVTTEIAFSTPASDVAMNTPIGSVTGGSSDGGTYFIVKTNNAAGFTLTANASTQPAMQRVGGGWSIPDYATSSSPTDYNFASAAPGNAHFGFSYAASSSADVHPDFLNDGVSCGVGSSSTYGKCWRGFAGTAPITLFQSSAPTPGSGATSSMAFKVSVGPNASDLVAAGTYQATITLTATTN